MSVCGPDRPLDQDTPGHEGYLFKSLSIKTAEQLYSLGILNELNQQELSLQNDLLDKFIICMVICEGDDVWITYER
ncbi:hypothetical protein RJ035_001618 [Blastomyces gilchristii]